MISAITKCRLCKSDRLVPILDLGVHALSGVFPRDPEMKLTSGPLQLVKCHGQGVCGLVQLAHDYDLGEMYGANYGYRSSLNRSMVRHLSTKVARLRQRRPVGPGDVVLDIGSNDGTTLAQYPEEVRRIGIDPTAEKFRSYYAKGIEIAPTFFDAGTFDEVARGEKARIVTSLAMFYDLPEPFEFVRDVARILADDGIWHLEQSYLPMMLDTLSYDTVCHEHLEYYGLSQIRWMTRRAGLRIVDVETNDVNGGSFAVTIAKGSGDAPIVEEMIAREAALEDLATYETFRTKVARHRKDLRALLGHLADEKKKVIGFGASTKGNVLLQHCGVDRTLLPAIAEVNADKFGCYTPGTRIPIIPEEEARKDAPDVFFVLPWHFRASIVAREEAFMASGGRFLFPLPAIELV